MTYEKKLLYSSLIIFCCITFMYSCNKKNDPTILYYDETGCNNPWDSYYTADSFYIDTLKQTINDFLINENIEVNSIDIHTDTSNMIFCYACSCPTGRVVTINARYGDKRKLKKLGFYQ